MENFQMAFLHLPTHAYFSATVSDPSNCWALVFLLWTWALIYYRDLRSWPKQWQDEPGQTHGHTHSRATATPGPMNCLVKYEKLVLLFI